MMTKTTVNDHISKCLQIASTPATKDRDYFNAIIVATNLFASHFPHFTEEQTCEVLSNPYIVDKIKKSCYDKLLKTAISNQMLIPQQLRSPGTMAHESHDLVRQYLAVVNKFKSEQIHDLFTSHADIVKKFYMESHEKKYAQSSTLTELVMSKAPELISQNTSWDKGRILHFIEQNREKIDDIINKMLRYPHASPETFLDDREIQHKIWGLWLDKQAMLPSNEYKQSLAMVARTANPAFFHFLKEHHPKTLSSLFHNWSKSDHWLHLQFKNTRHFSKLLDIFRDYREQFNEPTIEEVSLFTKEIPAMELALKNNWYFIFYLWADNIADLGRMDLELYCCACFKPLLANSVAIREVNKQWALESLEQIPSDIFLKYYERALPKLNEEDKTHVLKLYFEHTLSRDNAGRKKVKI